MDISTVVNDKRFQIGIASVVSAGIGFTIGYIFGKKNGDVFEISEEAIREFNVSDQIGHIVSDDVSSEDTDNSLNAPTQDNVVIKDYVDSASIRDISTSTSEQDDSSLETEYQGEVVEQNNSTDNPVRVNVFKNDNADWDYEVELSNRKPGVPYILHQDEFIQDEMGYRQDTCTYYQGDDIMTDPHDAPIYNYKSIMGELKFGHGSNDPNVVYVRNESMEMEWEILLHTGFYSYEVLGYEFEREAQEEIRHSVQKFRME